MEEVLRISTKGKPNTYQHSPVDSLLPKPSISLSSLEPQLGLLTCTAPRESCDPCPANPCLVKIPWKYREFQRQQPLLSALCTQTGQTNTGIISGRRAESLAEHLAAHTPCEARAGMAGQVLSPKLE